MDKLVTPMLQCETNDIKELLREIDEYIAEQTKTSDKKINPKQFFIVIVDNENY